MLHRFIACFSSFLKINIFLLLLHAVQNQGGQHCGQSQFTLISGVCIFIMRNCEDWFLGFLKAIAWVFSHAHDITLIVLWTADIDRFVSFASVVVWSGGLLLNHGEQGLYLQEQCVKLPRISLLHVEEPLVPQALQMSGVFEPDFRKNLSSRNPSLKRLPGADKGCNMTASMTWVLFPWEYLFIGSPKFLFMWTSSISIESFSIVMKIYFLWKKGTLWLSAVPVVACVSRLFLWAIVHKCCCGPIGFGWSWLLGNPHGLSTVLCFCYFMKKIRRARKKWIHTDSGDLGDDRHWMSWMPCLPQHQRQHLYQLSFLAR